MVAEADLIDGVGIDEVRVVASRQDGGHQGRGHRARHRSRNRGCGGMEAGPYVVRGQQDGDLVGGRALAHEVAHPADVAGDRRHDWMPRVVVVEDGGGVERPSGFGDFMAGR